MLGLGQDQLVLIAASGASRRLTDPAIVAQPIQSREIVDGEDVVSRAVDIDVAFDLIAADRVRLIRIEIALVDAFGVRA